MDKKLVDMVETVALAISDTIEEARISQLMIAARAALSALEAAGYEVRKREPLNEAEAAEIFAENARLRGDYLNICPGCGGVADNGHDREYPPSPYNCTKCEAEYARETSDD